VEGWRAAGWEWEWEGELGFLLGHYMGFCLVGFFWLKVRFCQLTGNRTELSEEIRFLTKRIGHGTDCSDSGSFGSSSRFFGFGSQFPVLGVRATANTNQAHHHSRNAPGNTTN
jgi:hypothetical protein